MNRYILAPLARDDLQSIWEYIAIENDRPMAADAQLARIEECFPMLAAEPLLGESRHDLRPDLRIFCVDTYVILYYPLRDGVEIAGVIHGARDISGMFRRGER